MDFFTIRTRTKNSVTCVYPDFIVGETKDIMVRGGTFYAIWDEVSGRWSTNEADVQRLVDAELYANKEKYANPELPNKLLTMKSFESGIWDSYKRYISRMFDSYHLLDNRVTFQNTPISKEDYVSHSVPYSLVEGEAPAYEELISTLYSPDERQKLEWAIGSVVAGDAPKIQKFIVLYGGPGSGKSTVLNIIQKLFDGYYAIFEAKALGSRNNQFATESFRKNPLVAIQHDGDLSRIEDNTLLNSIVAHEEIVMNEKHKSSYPMRINAMLFMGTNQPVKITDAKSGILRRLIDVSPTGKKIPPRRYFELMDKIEFELGAIASHCLSVYLELGKSWYSSYRPVAMMYETNDFANFVDANLDVFLKQDYTTLQQAWDLYKVYCDEALVQYRLTKRQFRSELMSYFEDFIKDGSTNNERLYNVYRGFLVEKVTGGANPYHADMRSPGDDTSREESKTCGDCLGLREGPSILDNLLVDRPAQYADDSETGKPLSPWDSVRTTLRELDTSRLHYVRPPLEHIVIDFDLKDEFGRKCFERNVEAASKWPETYAEVSKGGHGIHLHYIYDGDPTKLALIHEEGVEIKVFKGKSSLRRKLTLCNNKPVAHISSGLPLKGEKKVLNQAAVMSEKGLRELIKRNLRKEIHPGTKPSVDFILKILDEAYEGGMHYDVSDLRPSVLAFAANSTNHASECVKMVAKMKFASEEPSSPDADDENAPIVFFDVEVFPNLFVVCFKLQGEENPVVKLINPEPQDIERLFKYRLIGFNNRRYDNHILYGRYLGSDNEHIFKQSQRIISGSRNGFYAEAYNLSYTDIYDFAMTKQSLKKWEIELGIHHQENAYPWDKPLDESKWDEITEYCANDVRATETVFNHLSGDFKARLILSSLAGLTPNATTQQLVAKIIFGNDKNPQEKFVYTDLSEMFPGYKYEHGVSTFMGEEVGEGGYVYAEPGMYYDVGLLDIASMHPTSIEELNAFGPYTERFSALKQARILVKHHDVEGASKVLDGALAPYLGDEQDMDDLAHALKIAINIVYGLTSAKFDNPFRDPRNVDNIVAKRGALFMVLLKNECLKHGIPVAHIKTDSIKIPNMTENQKEFVMDFGKKYGYSFEHEATYERMCLVNNAVYIARYKGGKHDGEWTATGKQFAHPYVFKTLFSHEAIEFSDFCETRNTKDSLYLDLNEGLGEDEHSYHFVGKIGQFVPVAEGTGGGYLYRMKDDKYYSTDGGTDYRWKEAEIVKNLGLENEVDPSFARHLVDDAIENMGRFGDVEQFLDTEHSLRGEAYFRPLELMCQVDFKGCEGCPYHSEEPKICKYAFDVPF